MRGFTLIELLVFIAIVGILSSIALGGIMKSRTDLRDGKRVLELSDVSLALLSYRHDHGEYPDSLSVLVFNSYLGAIPRDPITGNEPFYEKVDGGAHLGIDLETHHSILEMDNDKEGALILGGDNRGCRGNPARACFDSFFSL